MSPFEEVANAAHEFSQGLPEGSADRALLFSRRYGFAAAAIKALENAGFAIVRRETLECLYTEGGPALTPAEAAFLRAAR